MSDNSTQALNQTFCLPVFTCKLLKAQIIPTWTPLTKNRNLNTLTTDFSLLLHFSIPSSDGFAVPKDHYFDRYTLERNPLLG